MKTNTKPASTTHPQTLAARLLLLLLLLFALPVAARAQFNYTTSNGQITITGYTGPSGAVNIPRAIDGLPVTSIGNWAFGNRTNLSSINIPNNVITIGKFAFAGCSRLTDIIVPENVIDLGPYAFQLCTGLKSVSIGDNVRFIKDFTFEGCTTLANLRLGNRVVSIGPGAFYRCHDLTSVKIPDSVTAIGDAAFSLCTSLTGIRIPDKVVVIGNFTFSRCLGLTGVTVGDSVTHIGDYAFAACPNLECVMIGSSVTAIGDFAFQNCTRLKAAHFAGARPDTGSDIFAAAEQVTIYPLSGTAGWGSIFAGRPTVMWNPRRLPIADCIGVESDQFGFTITGQNDSVIVVEASQGVTTPVWSPVSTNTLRRGSSYFRDPRWLKDPARLYRLRSP